MAMRAHIPAMEGCTPLICAGNRPDNQGENDMGTTHGPFQVMVVKFPGNRFSGEIVPALRDLVERGIIRIVDVVFVRKDADNSVEAFELNELPADELTAFESLRAETGGLLNESDVEGVANQLEANSSAGLMVWENVWATSFAQAVRNADGQVLVLEPIAAETLAAAMDAAGRPES
jgi:hypothetical protein